MSCQDAQALAELGMPVFRLKRGTKKHFVDTDWAKGAATVDKMEIFDRFGGGRYNIGVNASGYVVLDVDRKAGRDGFIELDALETRHGKLPATYTQETPSGGRHYVFDAGGETFGQRRLSPGIDVRANNGYFVGAGSEFEGKPYTKLIDVRPAPLPAWLRAELQQSSIKDLNAGKVLGELDTEAAIAAAEIYLVGSAPLAIEGDHGDDTTYKVANQCLDRGVSPARCLDLMLEHWNGRCSPPWEPEELERKVDSAVSSRQKPIGSDNPLDGFSTIEFPKRAVSLQSFFVEDEPDDAAIDWFIDGSIPRGGIGFLAGASGSGKTFVMIDLVGCLWRGLDWFGRKVDCRGGTYIVAAEGAYSIPHRIRASGQYRFNEKPKSAKTGPIMYSKGAPDLKSKAGRGAFFEELRYANEQMIARYGVPIRLVVIETFAQTFNVKDENAASDITAATKIMAEISNCLPEPLAVMASHHFGKANEGMRGSSALRANVDFVIEVRNNGELFQEKIKDAPEDRIGYFEMPRVTIGHRKDGREITSRYVRQTSGPVRSARGVAVGVAKPLDAAFVESFVACAKPRDGLLRCSVAELRELMFECWPNEKNKRTKFKRLVDRATAFGYEREGDWVVRNG